MINGSRTPYYLRNGKDSEKSLFCLYRITCIFFLNINFGVIYVTELAAKKGDECFTHSWDSACLWRLEWTRVWPNGVQCWQSLGSRSQTWFSTFEVSKLTSHYYSIQLVNIRAMNEIIKIDILNVRCVKYNIVVLWLLIWFVKYYYIRVWNIML